MGEITWRHCKAIIRHYYNRIIWKVVQGNKNRYSHQYRVPWLAASPDGLIEDPSESVERRHGILEIKCPYSARRMTPEITCHEVNTFCCTMIDGHVLLKKSHYYYYQVQGQLATTQLPWCYFVVWTPHGTTIQRNECDFNLWQQKSCQNLACFITSTYFQS